jgi:hypothetical protein
MLIVSRSMLGSWNLPTREVVPPKRAQWLEHSNYLKETLSKLLGYSQPDVVC